MEGLSASMNKVVSIGALMEFMVGLGGLEVCILLYVNDTFLAGIASMDNILTLIGDS